MNRTTVISAYCILLALQALPNPVHGMTENFWPELREDGSRLKVMARCGEQESGLNLDFTGPEGYQVRLAVRGTGMVSLNHHWQLSEIPDHLGDAGISLSLTGHHNWERANIRRVLFIRPDIRFYSGDKLAEAIANWDSYPPASEHRFKLELVRSGDKIKIWIDANYFISFPAENWDRLTIVPVNRGELEQVSAMTPREHRRFLPLDLATHSFQGDQRFIQTSLAPGRQRLEGVPFQVTTADGYIDTAPAQWLEQDQDPGHFYDPYYRRSAWDGVPESIMISIPKKFYNHLYLLAAVNPEKSPDLGIRIARYRQSWDGSGATQADVNISLDPADPGQASLQVVGELQQEIDGTMATLPLYLVKIPLTTGELADYLAMTGMDHHEPSDFFYLELTRTIKTRVKSNSGIFEKKPLGPASGVMVFGITLEEAPVKIMIGSEQTGNIFYQAESPELKIDLKNPTESDFVLSMSAHFTDYFGETTRLRQSLALDHGLDKTVAIPLENLEAGWYKSEFVFHDAAGNLIWRQPLSLALLPADTRQSTFNHQPHYGTWWFSGSHYSARDPHLVLPLIEKMGFRQVSPQNPEEGLNEIFESYGITPSMMNFGRIRRLSQPEEIENSVQAFIEGWPNTKYGMIFHETGGLPFGISLPPEVMGEDPPELTGDGLARRDQLYEQIRLYAGAIRKVAPEMKIILGNGTTNFNVHWLRERLPLEYWDALGMEMAVQTFSPEGQPSGYNLQSFWLANQMKKIYGYDNLPITSCYELNYRSTAPGALTLQRQADWYVRDVLHMLAYRVPNINPALIMDTNSAYYTSRWGGAGVLNRYPLLTPKPSFVALGTLTRMLDLAEYQRYLDTGSHGLYCLEFKRGETYVYALWATRGEYLTDLEFDTPTGEYQLSDSMGRKLSHQFVNRQATFTATESPAYLVTPNRLRSATGIQPIHPQSKLENQQIAALTGDPEEWRIVRQKTEVLEDWCGYQPLQQGEFTLEPGSDGGVRISLHQDPSIPDLVGRYLTIELQGEPRPVTAEPEQIGVWVNGNSNWGRVIFEVIDADGRTWTSNGVGQAPNSWDMSDWEDDSSINFDGWRFVSLPLPAHYASGYYAPSFRHWRRTGGSGGSSQLQYPLKVNRIHLIMREKLVYATDLLPAKSLSVELRNISFGDLPRP